MLKKIPTRSEAVAKLKKLIDGSDDHVTIGLWASEIDKPENKKKEEELHKKDPALRELLDTISLAAQIDWDGSPLYSSVEYEEWLNEFNEQIKHENRSEQSQ